MLPVILGKTILYANDRKAVKPVGDGLDHSGAVQDSGINFVALIAIKMRGSHINPEANVLARRKTRFLGRFDRQGKHFLHALKGRRQPAFVGGEEAHPIFLKYELGCGLIHIEGRD